MAMIDYGAIVWKDRKCVSTGMFDDMKKMVEYADDKDVNDEQHQYSGTINS